MLHHTFAMDGFHAGMLVTYLSLFLAMPLFLREGFARRGEAGAWRSVFFLLLFPTAFFLAAMYAEATFFLFSLLAFCAARAGRTRRAVLWGVLLGLTKASALAAAPALFLAALEPREEETTPVLPRSRRIRDAAWIGLAPFATVWAWVFGVGIAHGEPGVYFRSLAGWHRGSSPLSGAMSFFHRFADYFTLAGWPEAMPIARPRRRIGETASSRRRGAKRKTSGPLQGRKTLQVKSPSLTRGNARDL